MNRVRISTTVDGEQLSTARELLGLRDSDLFDRALAAVVREVTINRELAALDRYPYAADPELAMPELPPIGLTDHDLPYDAAVPAAVLAIARKRRAQRTR